MKKVYLVNLTATQREDLLNLLHRGKANARTLTRARILLKAGEGWTDEALVAALDTSLSTVERVRRRFVAGGLSNVLQEKPQPGRPRVLKSHQAAHLIAVACSPVPDGHDHWTARLLADKAVELGFVEGISPETIRQVLQKNETLVPGSTRSGVCPGWAPPLSPRWKRCSTSTKNRLIPASGGLFR